MGNDNKIYTYQEISLHNQAKDCWIIINAKAYNVTSFLDDHPGGGDVLLEAAGKDASEEFEAAGHGSTARLMLDEYYVGEMDSSSSSSSTNATNSMAANTFKNINISPEMVSAHDHDHDDVNNGGSSSSSSVSTMIKLFPLLIMPFLMLGLAAIINFFSTSSTAN